MLAYFIGGPEDLTKRHIPEPRPYYTVALMPPPETLSHDPSRVPELTTCQTVQYRLETVRHMAGQQVAIYTFLR